AVDGIEELGQNKYSHRGIDVTGDTRVPDMSGYCRLVTTMLRARGRLWGDFPRFDTETAP
ncbi:hypothetical protein NDR87_36650, partial [Nocardia sp. CDC159]